MDYKKYLQGDEWRKTRRRIWRKAKGRCEECERWGRQVHHKSYARVGHERDDDLVLLCAYCHSLVHGLLRGMAAKDHMELTGELLDTSQFPFGLS